MVIKLSLCKKMLYAVIMTVVLFALLNIVAIPFSRRDSVFWDNPLMMMYPVDSFDPNAVGKSHYNKDVDRVIRYVPDGGRWYRLDPEPVIPAEGELILNFGDSSTWGWGLKESIREDCAYSGVLNEYVPQGVSSVNLGIPGYSSLQGLKYVEEMIPRYADRLVAITIYFGNNDATENGSTDKEKLSRFNSGVVTALNRLPLCQAMSSVASRVRESSNQDPRVGPSEYGDNVRQMIRLAKSYNVPVVVIMPSVPLSWQPGYLNHHASLEGRVTNTWTRSELALARVNYDKGVGLLYQQDDDYERCLEQALEHDWVMPRIKTVWRDELRRVVNEEGVTLVELRQSFILAEPFYRFEDYCHPSPQAHADIAEGVVRALSVK